jgi:hypothetical protein
VLLISTNSSSLSVWYVHYTLQFIDVNHKFIDVVQKLKVVKQRIWQLQHRPRCAFQPITRPTTASGRSSPLASAKNDSLKAYVPPTYGWVRVRVIESYDCSHQNKVLSYPLCESKVNFLFECTYFKWFNNVIITFISAHK